MKVSLDEQVPGNEIHLSEGIRLMTALIWLWSGAMWIWHRTVSKNYISLSGLRGFNQCPLGFFTKVLLMEMSVILYKWLCRRSKLSLLRRSFIPRMFFDTGNKGINIYQGKCSHLQFLHDHCTWSADASLLVLCTGFAWVMVDIERWQIDEDLVTDRETDIHCDTHNGFEAGIYWTLTIVASCSAWMHTNICLMSTYRMRPIASSSMNQYSM